MKPAGEAGVMDWKAAKKAIERGLAPQISRDNKVSSQQYAMYKAVVELGRAQGFRMDDAPASAAFRGNRLSVEWERTQ